MTMKTVTLRQALELAAQGAYMDAHNKGADHAQRMAQAREYHEKRGLRANVATGTVRDCDGVCSQFTAYDWAHTYEDAPHFIYWDFFLPILANSADRLRRGLNP